MKTACLFKQRRRRPPAWLWLLLACVWPPLEAGPTLQVELLLSADDEAYRELAGAFQAELSLACANRCPSTPSVRVSTADDWQPEGARDLLVAVGDQAALQALVNPQSQVLYGLIPQFAWRNLNRLHPSPPGRSSVVYLEQPLSRQFDLLAMILPADRKRVGVLLGPDSVRLLVDLERHAARVDLDLRIRQVHDHDGVGPAIESLAGEIDLLLALPDPVVYNRDTLYGILLTSYGAGVPVAGYSEALARAGAMVALYTTAADMARHLAQTSAAYLRHGGPLPPSGPSRYFEIKVNHSVARSLGYQLLDAAELRKLLEPLGGGDGAAQAAQ